VNDCVVHGEPSNYILKNGDLLKIDAGLVYEKGYSDSAISVVIGGEMANPLAYDLISVNKEALDRGIETIVPGEAMFAYGSTVASIVQNAGYKVLKHLTGHGVGVDVHERPYVFNYGHPDMKKQFYKPGMVLCFEPIIAVMSDDFHMKERDEGMYTDHGDLGSQWEYMLLITEKGYEILSGITEFE
jgi:methionyl aminopeptidase